MPCGATQDGQVMVERSDRMWSTGEGNGKPLQYSCLENPMNSMTNLDSILKSKAITLLTKVHLVKAMVFPIVMYRYVLVKTLENPLDRKEIQPVNPKGNQHWIFIGRIDADAEAPILWPPNAELTYWKRPLCWERLKAGWEGDSRGWDGWGCKELDMTEQLNNKIIFTLYQRSVDQCYVGLLLGSLFFL